MMKKTNIYVGLFSLLSLTSLTACDTEATLRTLTGIRSGQVVDGPRRQPVLNRRMQSELTNKSGQPSSTPNADEQIAYSDTPKDDSWYGSAMRYVGLGDDAPEKVSTVQQIQPERSEPVVMAQPVTSVTESNLPAPMVDAPPASTNVESAPVNTAVTAQSLPTTSTTDDSHKILSDNPYYTPWSSIEPHTKPQPLSSVPEKPTRLDEIKNSHSSNLGELENDKLTAEQDKTSLDNEVKSEASLATTVPLVATPAAQSKVDEPKLLATKSSNDSLTTPPVPEVASEPANIPVASLPEVNVSAPENKVSPTEAPTAETVSATKPSDEIVATSEPMNMDATNDKKSSTPTSGFTPATSLFSDDDTLPSTNKIKTMRPSRYESRIRNSSYN